MLPRLQAEKQLARIEAIAVGTGSAKKADRQACIKRLERSTGSRQRAKPATMADIAAMGIAVEEG